MVASASRSGGSGSPLGAHPLAVGLRLSGEVEPLELGAVVDEVPSVSEIKSSQGESQESGAVMTAVESKLDEDHREADQTRVVRGRCHECHVQCAMLVHVRDGKVVKLEGDPKFVNQGALCAKGLASLRNLYHPERLNFPLLRTRPKGDPDPGWVRISWDEALDRIATRLKEIAAEFGGHAIAIGQGTGRGTVAQHMRLKNAFGSPNSLGPNHVCRGPNAASTTLSVGHHLRGDYSRSACQVYWGRNEPWAHPAFLAGMVMDNIIDRGSKVIVVDPRYEHPLAHKADVYLPVRPGSMPR